MPIRHGSPSASPFRRLARWAWERNIAWFDPLPYGSMDMIRHSTPLGIPTSVTLALINVAAVIGIFFLANG
jgi:hypothetical protein